MHLITTPWFSLISVEIYDIQTSSGIAAQIANSNGWSEGERKTNPECQIWKYQPQKVCTHLVDHDLNIINYWWSINRQIKDLEIKQQQLAASRTQPASSPIPSSPYPPSPSPAPQSYPSSDMNSEALQRGGGMQINSSFLTVKEVLTEYQSLRGQEYHNLLCELKKTLKEMKSKSWHKLYIAQTCHQFMFDMLQLCYKMVRKYADSIYTQIGSILCIEKVTV